MDSVENAPQRYRIDYSKLYEKFGCGSEGVLEELDLQRLQAASVEQFKRLRDLRRSRESSEEAMRRLSKFREGRPTLSEPNSLWRAQDRIKVNYDYHSTPTRSP